MNAGEKLIFGFNKGFCLAKNSQKTVQNCQFAILFIDNKEKLSREK